MPVKFYNKLVMIKNIRTDMWVICCLLFYHGVWFVYFLDIDLWYEIEKEMVSIDNMKL